MNESLSVKSNLEIDYRTAELDHIEPDFINPDWDDNALFNLVAANHDVLVKNGGMIMTLSEAIMSHPGPWVPENEANIIADIQQLLANRVVEAEEPEEEITKEEKIPEIVETKKNDEIEQEVHQILEKPEKIAEAPAEIIQLQVADTKHDTKISRQEDQIISHTGDSAGLSKVPKNEIENLETLITEPEIVAGLEKNKVTAIKETDIVQQAEADLYPPEKNSNLVAAKIEPVANLASLESFKAEPAEEWPEAIKPIAIADEIQEFIADDNNTHDGIAGINEEIKEVEHDRGDTEDQGFDSTTIQEVIDTEDYIEIEDELIFHLEDGPRISDQSIDNALEVLEPIKTTDEKINETLVLVIDKLSISNPETVETANEILEKITVLKKNIEDHDKESIIAEIEVKEEIIELFTELLNYMDVDYEPEQVEVLAYLAVKMKLFDEIEYLKPEEELIITPQGSGTHEIINNILVGLNKFNLALSNANAIGRSALQLYLISLAD